MIRNVQLFLLVIVFALAFTGIYFIGKKMGEDNTRQTLIENYAVIKKIAELGALEVQGTSEFQIGQDYDYSFTAALQKMFFENSVYMRVPYKAKYGVDLSNMKLTMEHTPKEVTVYLPEPQLLSYELKLNEAVANNKKGWFTMSDEETYFKVSKQLYEKSRNTLATNSAHKEAAKKNISELLKNYFSPFGFSVVVIYGKSSTINQSNKH